MTYELPKLFAKAEDWPARREELKKLAEDYMYGHGPKTWQARGAAIDSALTHDNLAIRETVRVEYGPDFAHSFLVTVIRPNKPGRFPVITWNLFREPYQKPCPIERTVIERGYCLASFDKEQLTHDQEGDCRAVNEAFPDCDFGSIRAWGWGHSALADFLAAQPYADMDKLVATGHSRGGKAALAAAIYDERFAVCAPINSGAGGAGCNRYLGDKNGYNQNPEIVESLGRVGHAFPHWWNAEYLRWGGQEPPYPVTNEADFPFDQHELKALIAPRALFTSEGLEDAWANPFGTYLTWKAAQPAFDLYGVPGHNVIHYRPGPHQFGPDDWEALLDFCDKVFFAVDRGHVFNNPPFAEADGNEVTP